MEAKRRAHTRSPRGDGRSLARHADRAARLLRTVGNRYRLMVLCALVEGELSVGEINERVSLSQSALSQHLAVLRRHALVRTRREAQTIYYSLAGDEARRLIALLHELYCA